MITVNGNSLDGYCGKTVAELVGELGYNAERIAVELNGDILKRALLADTVLADGDRLEIVCFVGGG